MNTIIDIVNQSKHPIDSDEYIQYCNDEIKKNYILMLNDILTNILSGPILKEKVTVNFENVGKKVINANLIELIKI